MKNVLVSLFVFGFLISQSFAGLYISETISSPHNKDAKRVVKIACENNVFESKDFGANGAWIETSKGYYYQMSVRESGNLKTVYGRVSNGNALRRFDCEFKLEGENGNLSLVENSVKCYCLYGNGMANGIIHGKYVGIQTIDLNTTDKRFSMKNEEARVNEVLCGTQTPSNPPRYYFE